MEPELIRPSTAAARYSLSRRTLSRRMRDDPDFPQPIRMNCRMVLFRRADLDAYFSSKQGQRVNSTEASNA